jgi:hypothetical protein
VNRRVDFRDENPCELGLEKYVKRIEGLFGDAGLGIRAPRLVDRLPCDDHAQDCGLARTGRHLGGKSVEAGGFGVGLGDLFFESLDAQVKQLRAAGAEKVFRETASGARADRAQLRRVLDQLDKGDVLLDDDGDKITSCVIAPVEGLQLARRPCHRSTKGSERIRC